ncbi:MAG: hypothetical protein GVY28_00755, partial [Alphaproteobacteria bacterium]|nr:hypothetical protein [Alphaproteobacteria bacterium]
MAAVRCRAWLGAILLAIVAVAMPALALAQSGGAGSADNGGETAAAETRANDVVSTIPAGLTPAQVDGIVALLDDTQAREALRRALLSLSAGGDPAPTDPPLAVASVRLADALAAIPALPAMVETVARQDAEAGYTTGPAALALRTLLIIAVGLAVGMAAVRALSGLEQRIEGRLGAGSTAERLARAGARLVADLCGIAAFAATIVVIYMILSPAHPRSPHLLQSVLTVVGAFLGILALSRFLLAPAAPGRRWLPVSDAGAGSVHGAVVVLATVAFVFTLPILGAEVLELPAPAILAGRLAFSLAVVATALVLIWRRRLLLGQVLSADGADAADGAGAAGLWGTAAAMAMTLCLAAVWLLWTGAQLTAARNVALEAGLSLLVLVLAPVATRTIDRALPTVAPGGAPAAGPGLRRAVRVVMVLVLLWLILAIWGVHPGRGEGAGAMLARIVFQGGVVLVLGYVGWLFLKSWLDRQIAKAQGAPTGSSASR